MNRSSDEKLYLLVRCIKQYAILNQLYEFGAYLRDFEKHLMTIVDPKSFNRTDFLPTTKSADDICSFIIKNELVIQYRGLYAHYSNAINKLDANHFEIINKKIIPFLREEKIEDILK